MCRHLAWFGAPRRLCDLVLTPQYGLLAQSYAPRQQAHGTINADGWGVGFFAEQKSGTGAVGEPARWRSERPLWGDASFASVAPHLRSGRVVAAVRSATVGMPLDASAAAPFLHDGWLVSHNGVVSREVVGSSLAAESAGDSALLAARIVEQGIDNLAATLHHIAAGDPVARMNLLLLSRDRLLAVAWGDTLYCRTDADGVLVASEPDATPGWTAVPDRHLLDITSAGTSTTSLEIVEVSE